MKTLKDYILETKRISSMDDYVLETKRISFINDYVNEQIENDLIYYHISIGREIKKIQDSPLFVFDDIKESNALYQNAINDHMTIKNFKVYQYKFIIQKDIKILDKNETRKLITEEEYSSLLENPNKEDLLKFRKTFEKRSDADAITLMDYSQIDFNKDYPSILILHPNKFIKDIITIKDTLHKNTQIYDNKFKDISAIKIIEKNNQKLNNKHDIYIALDKQYEKLQWGLKNKKINMSKNDGFNNTYNIINNYDLDIYPAFNYIKTYKNNYENKSGKWFIPSYDELKLIVEEIYKNDDLKNFFETYNKNYFWTSSLNNDLVYTVNITNNQTNMTNKKSKCLILPCLYVD